MVALRIGNQTYETKQKDQSSNNGGSQGSSSSVSSSSSSNNANNNSVFGNNSTTNALNNGINDVNKKLYELYFGDKEEKAEEKEAQEAKEAEEAKKAEKKEQKEQEKQEKLDKSIFDTGLDYSERKQVFEKSTQATDYMMQSELFKNDRLYGFNFDKEISELMNNDKWMVDLDTDGDGKIEKGVKLVDAIAASFDSELDLYVQDKVNEVMRKLDCYDSTALFGSPDSPALQELARLGIKVEAVGNAEKWQNRTYAFSLLDVPEDLRNGDINELMKAMYGDGETPPTEFKVIEDDNNKKASFLFSDCLIPDGVCQGAEMNFSSILDQLGKECISKADFIGNEDKYFELMEKIEGAYNDGQLTGDDTLADLYATRMNICDSIYSLHHINSSAYGSWEGGFLSYEEGMAKLAGRTPGMGMGAFKGYHGGSGSAGAAGSSPFTASEEAKERDLEKEQNYTQILNKKIAEYTKDNGSIPVGKDLIELQNEAKSEATATVHV